MNKETVITKEKLPFEEPIAETILFGKSDVQDVISDSDSFKGEGLLLDGE